MDKRFDLTGQRFGRLTVAKREQNDKRSRTRWLCICDCGKECVVSGNHLRRGHTKSCGCLNIEKIKSIKHYKKHGLHSTRLYRIWNGIKNRTNLNNVKEAYKNYSGRGITICEEWKKFLPFYNWAIQNGYKENLTIDRINVDGDYEPDNCRWVSYKVQQNNKRNNHHLYYNGEDLTISQWTDKLKLPPHLIYNRLKRGWDIERALNYGKTN